MMSASSCSAGLQQDPVLGEPLDVVGDDRGLAAANGREQIAVGHKAQPLIPRVVSRVEVGVDVVALGQCLGHHGADHLAHALRMVLGEVVDELLTADIEDPGDPVGQLVGQRVAQFVGDRILLRNRHHIGRRTLQHGDVFDLVGHCRDERHRGRATADDHDLLAVVVQVFGPLLGVHDDAGELIASSKLRRIATLRSRSSRWR